MKPIERRTRSQESSESYPSSEQRDGVKAFASEYVKVYLCAEKHGQKTSEYAQAVEHGLTPPSFEERYLLIDQFSSTSRTPIVTPGQSEKRNLIPY